MVVILGMMCAVIGSIIDNLIKAFLLYNGIKIDARFCVIAASIYFLILTLLFCLVN